MIPLRISGATRNLGAPAGWDPERDQPCSHLAIRDEVIGDLPVMFSLWEPTPAELERLNAGAAIQLHMVGTAHPPVGLMVTEVEA